MSTHPYITTGKQNVQTKQTTAEFLWLFIKTNMFNFTNEKRNVNQNNKASLQMPYLYLILDWL